MAVGSVRSLQTGISLHPTGPLKKVLLCAMAVGLAIVASAQPFPSFMLDTTYVCGRDYSTVWATGSDFGDTLGLVAWVGGSVWGIQGCRVRRDMSVVDSICIDISGSSYYASVYEQHSVDVAWSGENYLVVWLTEPGLCAALVSPQGEVVRRTVIWEHPHACNWVSVASDGSGFLVTWAELFGQDAWEMYRLVSREGTPLDTARRVSLSGGSQGFGDAEFAGSCYMVVFWRDESPADAPGLSAVRIRPDGSLLDSVPIPIHEGAPSLAPTVGRFGDDFYVAWGEGQDSTDIRMARVTQGGVVVDSGGVVVGRDSGAWDLASAPSGDTCLLAWRSYARESAFVRALRVNAQAQPLDSTNLDVSSVPWAPLPPVGISVLPAADFAVVWCQPQVKTSHGNQRDVVCRRITSSGVLVDSTDCGLSYAANTQLGFDVASDGKDFLAVWQTWSGLPLTPSLRMKRFSSVGTLLDSVGIPVGDSSAYWGAVAYGPGFYMACWVQSTSYKIEAVRVGRDGAVVDTLPILVSQCPTLPGHVDIAYGDSMFLVVWERGGSGVFGVRVRAEGVVLDSVPKRVAHGTYFCFNPYVASDGRGFLVTHNGGHQGLYAARLDSAGLLLDSADIYLGDVPGEPDWSAPVAFGAGFYMVYDWGGSRTWLMSPSTGEVLSSLRGLSLAEESTVSFDGVNFLISGRAGRHVGHSIGAQRISPDGVLQDSSPRILTTVDSLTSLICYYDGCAADTNGNIGLMFTSYERPRYMSYRVRALACPTLAVRDQGSARLANAMPAPTVTRGMLFLPGAACRRPLAACLLDVAGRRVLELHPGPNDVRALAPGVYFVREQPQSQAMSVRKVVVTR